MSEFLEQFKYFIFDADGTLLLGKQALPFASDILHSLQKHGLQFTILSNNSSYSIDENKSRLSDILKVKLSPENIYTSTQATIEFLRKNNITQCYVVGTPGMVADMNKSGILNSLEDPQAIILGFDKTLNYKKIKQTSLLLKQKTHIPFYATHPDDTCPTEEGEIPDVGSFLKMFEQATGRSADIIFGKPNEIMLRSCLEKSGVKPSKVLVIGDRLETDIKMANDVGVKSVLLVNSHESQHDLEHSEIKPTKVWKDLEELYKFLK